MEPKKIELKPDLYKQASQGLKSFTELLEELDPSAQYPDSKLDAFERQCLARGLVLSGPNSVSLEVFYDKTNRVLFPEIINRTIREGLIQGRNALNLNDIVATRSEIESDMVRQVQFDIENFNAADASRRRVSEGARFPEISVTLGEKEIKCRKYGRSIKITAEARRRMRIDQFALGLKVIAMSWAKDMLAEAIAVLQSGVVNVTPGEAGTIGFTDMVKLGIAMDPYESNIWIANKTGCEKILSNSMFHDPRLYDTAKTGNWGVMLGNTLKLCDLASLTNKVMAVDSRFALEQVTERGSLIQDEERVADGQWDKVVISLVTGFGKMFGGAVQQLDYSGT